MGCYTLLLIPLWERTQMMPLKIDEVLTAALPIKCAEFLSLNKLLGNSVTLNDMYGYINSTEVLEAIYEAMEDELVGKDFSKSAVFVITTIKKVMASQIQKMSDEVIRNIFCELTDKDVIQFIQQDEMNKVIEFVRQTPIQDMLHCTRLRDVELSELVGEAVVKVIHSRKALHMCFILK